MIVFQQRANSPGCRAGVLSVLAGFLVAAAAALGGSVESAAVSQSGWSQLPEFVQTYLSEARLTSLDGKTGDGLGVSAAVSGETIVVGTPFANVGKNDEQGAVYVFVKPAGGWASTSTFTAKLTASNGEAFDRFGSSLAISGDTIVVGAESASFSDGAAYVFVKPAQGWATTSHFDAELTAADGASSDALGLSVAIDGNTIVAGAPGATIASKVYQGAAYVFVKKAAGWASTSHSDAKLTAADGQAMDEFGDSVAISGGTIVSGSPLARIGANNTQGAIYVFVKAFAGWATTSVFKAKLTASDGAAGDEIGSEVAISGDVVIFGLPSASVGANSLQGVIDVFVMPPSGWVSTSTVSTKLTASDGIAGTALGGSIAISGDQVIASAVGAGSGTEFEIGVAYVFGKPSAGWGTGPPIESKLEAPDDVTGAEFGFAVGISGESAVVSAANAAVGSNLHQGAAYAFEEIVPPCGDSLPVGDRGCVGPLSGTFFPAVNGR